MSKNLPDVTYNCSYLPCIVTTINIFILFAPINLFEPSVHTKFMKMIYAVSVLTFPVNAIHSTSTNASNGRRPTWKHERGG